MHGSFEKRMQMKRGVKRRARLSREENIKAAHGEMQPVSRNRENQKSGHLETMLFFVDHTYGRKNKDIIVNLGFHITPTRRYYCILAWRVSNCSVGQTQR